MEKLYIEINLETTKGTIIESIEKPSTNIYSMPIQQLVEKISMYGGEENIKGYTLQVNKMK